MIKSDRNLEVYVFSYKIAMYVFRLTRNYFPKEEMYSLTSQLGEREYES